MKTRNQDKPIMFDILDALSHGQKNFTTIHQSQGSPDSSNPGTPAPGKSTLSGLTN